MPGNSTQPEVSCRTKVGLRGVRPRGNISENANSKSGMGSLRSPRLGCAAASKGRSMFPVASSRPGTTFGTDITNITGRVDKLKPLKQLQQPQQPEPMVLTLSSLVEAPSIEQQKHGKTEGQDAQMAEEYAADINTKLFQDEISFMPGAHYMDTQADLTPKMRMILIDWLIEVHMKYKLRSETLHLTVNLIDRYLTKVQVVRKRLQLVGVVAMFIASKFEEINPPELSDWVYITDKAYTKEDVLAMEVFMLTALSFQIVVPTAAHFFPVLQKANGCDSIHCELAQYIIELGLLNINMLQYAPSHVVSAALLLSNELLGRPSWPQIMIQQSHHTEASLKSCKELMRELFEADRASEGVQLQALRKKFSMANHKSVATMKL